MKGARGLEKRKPAECDPGENVAASVPLRAVQHMTIRPVPIVPVPVAAISVAIFPDGVAIRRAPEFRDEHRRQILQAVFAFRASEMIAVTALAEFIRHLINDERRVRFGREHIEGMAEQFPLFRRFKN